MKFPIHVRTMTGLEKPLAEELSLLGASKIRTERRVVLCEGDIALLYKIALRSRVAVRVLRPVATFPAKDEDAFYEGVKTVDWSRWMASTGTLAIDADVRSSFSTHSLYLAQLAKDAVVDQFRDKTGHRPSVDLSKPDLRIVISLFQNNVQIFVDASGESLHKRGYRLEGGDAPLKENLAAGILKLAEWKPTTPLVDPMAGSGTFLIEAGMIAKNIAPGLMRKQFGFQKWADYDREIFKKLVAEAKAEIVDKISVQIVGIDIDPRMVEIARANIDRAGLKGVVKIEQADFFTWDGMPKTRGTLVMNPPYDERLTIGNAAEHYQKIGQRLHEAYQGWSVAIFSGNLEALSDLGLKTSENIALRNGAIDCRLVKLEVTPESKQARSPMAPSRWVQQSEILANRIRKNMKHYGKWARREGISCFRVYDRDIPELPYIIDVYADQVHFSEVPRNHDHTPLEHASYLKLMAKVAAETLGIPPDKVHLKTRKPQKADQDAQAFTQIDEANHKFFVNLSDFVETGLMLEHRKTRALIKKEAAAKDFLNLYGYTGAFSVYAAAGEAKSTTTVDTVRTFLEWAEKNFKLNGIKGPSHKLVREDAMQFLEHDKSSFDLCVVDPPTRSMNRTTGKEFEIQKDHVRLLRLVLDRMRPGGKVYFLTHFQDLVLDESSIKAGRNVQLREITPQTIPTDFERKPTHRCWLIDRRA